MSLWRLAVDEEKRTARGSAKLVSSSVAARTGLVAGLTLLLALVALPATPARGDGMVVRGRDRTSMKPALEREQIAAILHDAGVQRMVLAVDFETGREEQALWIFPVPGNPAKTSVEILDSFPRFEGRDPRGLAASSIGLTMSLIMSSQLYCLPGLATSLLRTHPPAGITVHRSVERWGIEAEVLSAGSVAGLAAHLEQRGASVEERALESLVPYFQESYVLVAVWIASAEEVEAHFGPLVLLEDSYTLGPTGVSMKSRRPCVRVDFATEQPFYPFRPTSVYGANVVPLRLIVVGGWFEPVTSARVSFEVEHFVQRRSDGMASLGYEALVSSAEIRYSVITAQPRGQDLTDDVRFEIVRPVSMAYASLVDALGDAAGIGVTFLLLGVLSCLAAGTAAHLQVGEWKPYFWLGLGNLISIGGFLLLVWTLRVRGKPLREAQLVLPFTLTFVALAFLAELLLVLPLGWAAARLEIVSSCIGTAVFGVLLALLQLWRRRATRARAETQS